MNYKRFRHFGKDKVLMDFSFLAIAFNIKKMCTKMNKEGINWPIKHLYGLITTHLSYWEQNIEIIFRISLLEKVNNALIVDKEKRVNRVLRHTLAQSQPYLRFPPLVSLPAFMDLCHFPFIPDIPGFPDPE